MDAAQQIRSITPFLVMDVMERANALAAQGREVIHLEVGEPD
ncbi:MAG TPA: pyridoxal phosphate-dependent aminotransferase, partial [Deltaproteobacteria bacterium]|nr:pyridoxal phosphate-dependent aminotransferase [Deltaproteobacteria bacterium]